MPLDEPIDDGVLSAEEGRGVGSCAEARPTKPPVASRIGIQQRIHGQAIEEEFKVIIM